MYGLYTNWRFLFDFLHSEEDSVFNSTLNSSDCRICMKKDLIQEGHLLTLCFWWNFAYLNWSFPFYEILQNEELLMGPLSKRDGTVTG